MQRDPGSARRLEHAEELVDDSMKILRAPKSHAMNTPDVTLIYAEPVGTEYTKLA